MNYKEANALQARLELETGKMYRIIPEPVAINDEQQYRVEAVQIQVPEMSGQDFALNELNFDEQEV